MTISALYLCWAKKVELNKKIIYEGKKVQGVICNHDGTGTP